MVMGLHKLTAGTGYLYLVRQVAAHDRTHTGRGSQASLGDYYSSKGETPGRWGGRGLAGLASGEDRFVATDLSAPLWRVEDGSEVTEDQMKALFGLGVHPNAEALTRSLMAQTCKSDALEAAKLGNKFVVNAGETELRQRLGLAYRDHNLSRGEHWNATIAESVRAQMRTRIAGEMFEEEHGRAPADERELTGFVARGTRELTTSVAGYDLTFTPVKSVAALHALAPQPIAQTIEDCHHRALNDALEMLQDSAVYTRVGAQGVAQIDTEGFIYAAFTHRDTRASDPGLHTHVAVSNKVRGRGGDGVWRWYALDGRPLYAAKVTASELYNTRLEAYLGQELGLGFAERGDAASGKREVREVVGVPAELTELWSSRRAAINAEYAVLAKIFLTDHGREPSSAESLALFQQANLATRAAKHEPRSQAEQRQQWRTEAVTCLGSEDKVTAMLADCLSTGRAPRHVEVTDEWVDAQAAQVIATVSESRATWAATNVAAEAQRRIRATGHAAIEGLAQRITEAALNEHSIAYGQSVDDDLGEPEVLRRRDGSSVFRHVGAQRYTSTEILAAETRILAAAKLGGGRTAAPVEVDLALLEQAANGRELNAGQTELVRRMASTGQRVALALAPAGSGKTTAMAALARAWEGSGGTVIGLSPSANAAQLLRAEINVDVADTVDKFTWLHDNPERARTDAARRWFDSIDESTLLIVDEAGKTGTLALDKLIAIALARGASVRLIGDDRQLSSISAGGVLRDLAHECGAITLSQIMRFTSSAEAHAGLALRDGDPAGIAFYLDNDRVHVGTEAASIDMAFAAWSADIAAGQQSLLLAPTHPVVDELNDRARLARLHDLGEEAPTDEARLAAGARASVGDLVFTKKNARHLRFGRNDFVRNGYRWHVSAVNPDGSMTVRHLDTDTQIDLPADYVGAHVSLGYATTIDAAQGDTADYQCHTVGSDALTREHVYTALTRGRRGNHIYFSTAETDPHRILAPKATHPDTAVDVLTRALSCESAQQSATTLARLSNDPSQRLAAAAAAYTHAVATAAEQLLTPAEHDALDRHAEKLLPGLTKATAWPVLRQHLCLIAAHGYHPIKKLAATIGAADLTDAADSAAVIDWRLDPTGAHSGGAGPLPWLPAIPSRLRNDPQWGTYLERRAELVTTLEREVRAQATGWDAATAPRWARPIAAADPELAAEVAVYRAATAVPDPDTRIAGAAQYPARLRKTQRRLHKEVTALLGAQTSTTGRYNELVDTINPHIRQDPFWPQLATHLDHAARTGVNIDQLVTAAAQRPLPDELPAAALWWRLSGTLPPDAAETAAHSALAEPDTTLAAASAEAQALREQYQGAHTELAALEAAVARRSGPATEQLDADTLRHLRDRADADRPYLAAVESVIDQWNDAETVYAETEKLIAHADTQLHALRGQPDAGPLDVTSAAQHLAWLQNNVRPAQSPAEQFYPALQEAIAGREQAAGSADQVITHADVDALLAQAAAADDALLCERRAELKALHARLSAAETAAAEAFATAQLHTADHITAQLPTMHTELRILDAAGHPSFASVLNLPPGPADDTLTPTQADSLRALAATAFALSPAYSPDRPALQQHMNILARTAAEAGRQIIWASTTAPTDTDALTADVISADDLHITGERTPPGTLVVIDHAEHLDPDKLADLAEAAAAAESRIILLDTDSRPPTASATMLAALHKDLPWSQTLTSTTTQRANTPTLTEAPDRQTARTQARGLSPAHHTPDITEALTRYHQLLTHHRRAHQTHTQIRGITPRSASRDRGRSR